MLASKLRQVIPLAVQKSGRKGALMKLSKRLNRSGKYSWIVRWYEGNTRRCVTFKNIESEEMAKLAAAKLFERRERGAAGLPTDPRYTVKDALDTLTEARKGLVKDRQFERFKCMAKRIGKILGDGTPVTQLTAKNAAKLRQHLQTEKFSPYTINKHIGFLVAAIEAAVQSDIIGKNPLRDIERVSDDRREVWRFLGEAEVAKLFAALTDGYDVEKKSREDNAYNTHYKAPVGLLELVVFLLNTGARLSEALGCVWRDVNFKAKQIRLVTSKRAARGRSATSRYIPINTALRSMLDRLYAGNPSPDAPILTISPVGLSRRFSILSKRAGLGHVRIHDLRHSFCSALAASGAGIKTIQELAGHSTIQMSARYMHLAPGAKQAAVDALNFGATGKGARVVELAEKTG